MSQARPVIRGGLPTLGACHRMHCARQCARHGVLPLPLLWLPYFLCVSPSLPRCSPLVFGVGLIGVWGRGFGGGGGVDASIGSRPPAFPLGWADGCIPRQGVTFLYGLSICTRIVQMDLRRSQVLRPFPTPAFGTLCVAGELLLGRRGASLPRWRLCPTRNPSLGTNRSSCRGEHPVAGPLATPQAGATLGCWPTPQAYPTLLCVLRWGRYGDRGAPLNS